ncbi:lactosylceramide 4-alpha-galactosyltransferase-like isoform X2 [Schistocerca nitens]|uniref:lactosylceramide 4-alpha-galactosyltransferase-like isoform X2 n=1 Tax=Schistocerca nitens TaxID=7011 RepID=UPI002117ED37|nr:lactosylceramide 4-alpha-galactosyltransferase-like isoform X2 [Schistocerca nitens]
MLLAVPLTSAEVRMTDGRDTYAPQGNHLQVPLLERQPMSPTIRCRYTRKTYVIVLLCAAILVTWSVASFPKHKLWPYDQRTVPQRGAANIFFIETTCAIEDVPWSGLRPRQACAVESAVRHNPGRPVYVLHTCEAPIWGLSLPAGATAVHVTLEEFLRDTPLYTTLIEYAALANSAWPVHHASDVMRVIALWKYGGLYLDLDFVVLRNLSELGEDWAGAEDNITVANSAMHMSARPGSAGQEMAKAFIETLQTDFDGQQWMYNGGGHLTRLLFIRCNVTSRRHMTLTRHQNRCYSLPVQLCTKSNLRLLRAQRPKKRRGGLDQSMLPSVSSRQQTGETKPGSIAQNLPSVQRLRLNNRVHSTWV